MRRAAWTALLGVLLMAGCAELLPVRQGGFNLISLDEEWKMGADLAREIEKKETLVRDPEALAYLNRIGGRLVRQTPLAGRPWQFHIIEGEEVNAFNIPGGHVYVHTGLIREATSLDQLTGVMAHEVAHGAARHGTQLATRQAGYSTLASLILGKNPKRYEKLLGNLAGTGVLMDYSRDAEREADRLGVRYAYDSGYAPQGMVDFLRKLLAMRERKPTHVERFFSSHPVTEERVATVEALAAELPPTALVRNTPDYSKFRERFTR
jgi:predicted Zn-dependent protease